MLFSSYTTAADLFNVSVRLHSVGPPYTCTEDINIDSGLLCNLGMLHEARTRPGAGGGEWYVPHKRILSHFLVEGKDRLMAMGRAKGGDAGVGKYFVCHATLLHFYPKLVRFQSGTSRHAHLRTRTNDGKRRREGQGGREGMAEIDDELEPGQGGN